MLYLNEKEKRRLDGLILLDPTWLTKMMRIVMELKTGKGKKLPNDEKEELKTTARIKLCSLRRCWGELEDDVFHQLCLILQSFCLIFPLPVDELHAPERSASTPTSSTPAQQELSQVLDRSQSEGQASSYPDTVYLIPSKLNDKPFDESLKKSFNFTFMFDFCGFFPVEVYHRLLCLMLKNQRSGPIPKGTFTAKYFLIKGVHDCNWIVQMIGSKLRVSVKYPKRYRT